MAREEAPLDDVRAILGNDVAVAAYRAQKLPFPEQSMLVRIAWSLDSSPENDRVFGRHQSFVAGAPKNGVQIMIKDSRKYADTGGWGFGQFENGKPVPSKQLAPCFPCHAPVSTRDFVFTRYAH